MTNFYLMLGITPLYAISSGSGDFSAAITTTVFMLATVGAELSTTTVMRRIGQQATLALGIVLLGLPVFALLLASALPVILVVSAVRGIGFAFVIIAGAAMIAGLTDESRHGRGIALYGVVVGIPSVLALPFGVWLVEHVGFAPLFIFSGLVALVGIVTLFVRIDLPRPDEVHGLMRTLRQPAVLRLAIVFFFSTLAAGVVITWAPITGSAVHGSFPAAAALFAYSLAATGARWLAGRFGDSRDPNALLVPGFLIGAAGLLLMALLDDWMIVGALIFGLGLGLLQNATLQLMFKSAGPSGYGSASAIWNVAYDLGLAIGAFGFGALSASYSLPLLVSAAVVLAAIAVLALWRRSGSSDSSQVTAG